jgi:hypothetical protein
MMSPAGPFAPPCLRSIPALDRVFAATSEPPDNDSESPESLRRAGTSALLRSWASSCAGASLCTPTYKERSLLGAMRHARELHACSEPVRCVVVGDSHVERMRELFDGRFGAYLAGIGGDGVEHLRFRLCLMHRLLAGASTIVVACGVNNVLGGKARRRGSGVEATSAAQPVPVIAAALQGLVDDLVAASTAPRVEVVVCHVLRVRGSRTIHAAAVNARVDELNARIDGLARCRVLRTALPAEGACFDADGLHLSRRGYELLVPQLLRGVPELAPAGPAAREREETPSPPRTKRQRTQQEK